MPVVNRLEVGVKMLGRLVGTDEGQDLVELPPPPAASTARETPATAAAAVAALTPHTRKVQKTP